MRPDRVFTGESADLSPLEGLWRAIDERYGMYLNDTEDGAILTPRKIDRGQAGGHRAYTQVSRLLSVAMENHEALHVLMKNHGLSMWSSQNLLRPTFEASFYALWILDPQEGQERRLRGLRTEWEDQTERRKYLNELQNLPDVGKQVAEWNAQHMAKVTPVYQSEADKMGVQWSQVKQKVIVLDELGNLSLVAGDKELAATLRGMWRSLSGVQHGLGYPAVINGEIRDATPIEGGQRGMVTVKDDHFVLACQMTGLLFVSALNRWLQLGGSPRNLG